MAEFAMLSDDELFAEVLRRRSADPGASEAGGVGRPLGVLTERWKRPACYVIRKIQSSYARGTPDDEEELFQEAVRRLLEKGLDQYRGVSEMMPGKAASPRTFFLRIVKHLTIDTYRRHREELFHAPADPSEAPEVSAPEAAQASERAARQMEQGDARELYWMAFDRLKREHPNEAEAWDVYHHQDAEDHESAAKTLGISVQNSYKRVSRAQAHLRLYLLELSDR
jgi:RNA polymerase sigma-70 factor, ECF subfamily